MVISTSQTHTQSPQQFKAADEEPEPHVPDDHQKQLETSHSSSGQLSGGGGAKKKVTSSPSGYCSPYKYYTSDSIPKDKSGVLSACDEDNGVLEDDDLSGLTKMVYRRPSVGNGGPAPIQSSSGCGLEVIDRGLTRLFHWLGVKIGENPSYFIIIPIFVSLLLGTGMQRLIYVDDPEYLFSPIDGKAKFEREVVDNLFPMNYSDEFHPSRFVRPGRFLRLFIKAKDGGTLLRSHVWQEIVELDHVVHNTSIFWEEEEKKYEDICAKWKGDCYENTVLELGEIMEDVERGNVSLTYPVMLNPNTFETYAFPFTFGGVKLTNVSTIISVQALQLNYFLAVSYKKTKENARGEKWEEVLLNELEKRNDKWKYLHVSRFAVRTLATELERNTFSILPYFSVTVALMIVFTVITCMMFDWVKSKPWLGLVGVISSTLGSFAAFGLVCYCGVQFIGINMAAPFLMLGIGIDDTFVMLASWRRTSPHDPVPKRMGEAYAEAAVSITITSITDMLSFWVGVITPFPCVKIFSIYSGAAVVATYLWHIFFFGGAIALSGYHEADNRHSVLWWKKAIPKSQSKDKSFWYRFFWVGGINPDDPFNPKDNPDHGIMVFFRDYWGSFLNLAPVKIVVIAVFVSYLGVSLWGATKIQEGLERRRMVLYDSYAAEFFDVEDQYFREYPYRIQVVISGALDYSNETNQKRIEKLMRELEDSEFVRGKFNANNAGALFTESWLRAFLGYVDRSKEVFDFNITTEAEFIETLKDNYLEGSVFEKDVKFNEDNSTIIASRFIIQTVNISDSNAEKNMADELRTIAANQEGLNVTVYHPFFIFFDQFLLIRYTSMQCVLIAALIMMGVSLVFIPNPLCSLWVAFSIISIEIGVIGFMTLWGVNLDAISMINLIMCIGFSVDFSAHISYAYMSAQVDTPEERVKSCLYSLGLPIVQGALSTILGVVALLVAPSYIFITFFKVVFLVIVIAAAHGLLLLPVLLSLFGPGSCKAMCGDNDSIDLSMDDGNYKKDKVVPFSFVVSPAGLDPRNNNNGYAEKYRRGSQFGSAPGFQDGQFINSGILPPIPRVSTTKAPKISTPPSRNSLDRDLGIGTSGEDCESSESSLSKKNNNNLGHKRSSSQSNLTQKTPNMKEMYANDGYISDDDELEPSRKISHASNNNSRPSSKNTNSPSNSNSSFPSPNHNPNPNPSPQSYQQHARRLSLPADESPNSHSTSNNSSNANSRKTSSKSHRNSYVSESKFP